MDLPPRMRRLPQYQGLPIPFFTLIRDGRPDFRVHSNDRHAQAMLRKLCGVCGQGLDYWLFFIGGPAMMRERLSYMPAMHEECARASLKLCPFMAIEERSHRKAPLKPGDIALAKPPPKPPRSAIAKTRSYKVVMRSPQRGMEFAEFAKPVSVEWFRYVNGELVPEMAQPPHVMR